MGIADALKTIARTAESIAEGMAVTFSHLFREPITVQYPDKLDRPVSEMLPARYRGFLEVQMDICTGCKCCERACPIECIAIDLVKSAERRAGDDAASTSTWANACTAGSASRRASSSRPAPSATRASSKRRGRRSTRSSSVSCPRHPLPLYKAPKDPKEIPVGEYGPHAREARERAMRDNPDVIEPLRDAWFEKNAKRGKRE